MRVVRVLVLVGVISALLASASVASGAQDRPSTVGFEENLLPGEQPLLLLGRAEVEDLIRTDLSAWVEVRKWMGFSADSGMVADLAHTKEGQLGMAAWSVPLTFEEIAEMAERARATSNSGEIRRVLDDMDGYADMYMDHAQGGAVVVNFARDLDQRDAKDIADLFVDPDRVVVRRVQHSLKDLNSLATALRALDRSEITSVVLDPKTNAIVVGVAEEGVTTPFNPVASPNFLAQTSMEVRGKLAARDPLRRGASFANLETMITFEVVPHPRAAGCHGRMNCGTTAPENWRGGTGLDTNQSGAWGGSNCTTGFVFTRGNARFLSTSGHCDVTANRDVAIAGQNHSEHSPTGFDRFFDNSLSNAWPVIDNGDYNNSPDSDAALILIHPDRSDNRIYKSYQKKNWYINDRDDNFMVGDVTCISGAVTQWRCGEVIAVNPGGYNITMAHDNTLTYFMDNLIGVKWIWPGVQTTSAGNSGSPLIEGRRAHGLYVAETSVTLIGPGSAPNATEIRGLFSRVSDIEADLNVAICLSAADC